MKEKLAEIVAQFECGCSNCHPKRPEECPECVRAFVDAIHQLLRTAAAEREFLDASIAVWRELDKASPNGTYVGQPLPIHNMDSELRVRERQAWVKYRDTLTEEE